MGNKIVTVHKLLWDNFRLWIFGFLNFRKKKTIKIKSALPPPPNPKYHPPPKTRNFMDMGFPAERTQFFQAPIKLAQPFPAPEMRTKIWWTRGFILIWRQADLCKSVIVMSFEVFKIKHMVQARPQGAPVVTFWKLAVNLVRILVCGFLVRGCLVRTLARIFQLGGQILVRVLDAIFAEGRSARLQKIQAKIQTPNSDTFPSKRKYGSGRRLNNGGTPLPHQAIYGRLLVGSRRGKQGCQTPLLISSFSLPPLHHLLGDLRVPSLKHPKLKIQKSQDWSPFGEIFRPIIPDRPITQSIKISNLSGIGWWKHVPDPLYFLVQTVSFWTSPRQPAQAYSVRATPPNHTWTKTFA